MLVIEGPDMVGKSSLVAAVAAEAERHGFRVDVDKFGMAESHCMLKSCRQRVRSGVIADRCWVSEIIYGTVVGGDRPRVTPEESKEIYGLVKSAGGLVVVVTATETCYKELVARHHARGEEYDIDTCSRVNALYGELCRDFPSSTAGASRRHNSTLAKYGVHVDMHYAVRLSENGDVTYPSSDSEFVKFIVCAWKHKLHSN